MAASLYSPQLNRDDHHYALKGLLQQTHKGKYPLLFSKIPASSSNCACRFFVLTLAELESLTVGPQPIEPSEENFWVLFSWMSMPLETVSQQTDAVAYNLLVLTNETEGLSGYGLSELKSHIASRLRGAKLRIYYETSREMANDFPLMIHRTDK